MALSVAFECIVRCMTVAAFHIVAFVVVVHSLSFHVCLRWQQQLDMFMFCAINHLMHLYAVSCDRLLLAPATMEESHISLFCFVHSGFVII